MYTLPKFMTNSPWISINTSQCHIRY